MTKIPASTRRDADLAAFEEAIGHTFADRDLLDRALTHSGAAQSRTGSYQRLEFLGDRVLGLGIAEMLFHAFPDAEEGELSRRLAGLVRRETCAAVAAEWGAEAMVKVGSGERGSRTLRKAILGDICEAVIGAVFVDGGIAAARALIERGFANRMHDPARPLRDPKTTLQEWAQAAGLGVPVYRQVARSGPDHAPLFTIAVVIERCAEAVATGASKRLAEQAAATAFMEREGIRTVDAL